MLKIWQSSPLILKSLEAPLVGNQTQPEKDTMANQKILNFYKVFSISLTKCKNRYRIRNKIFSFVDPK
ncbi:hypothetical protein MICAG_20010 [Microcystis aeruginosa PCC 9808]|uniref:Uncharacterized protein n=1 Tax=Microcystis aeruginosa PCC 9808 TaxID=1160284 RepID=I4HMF7_MICAE|nr:hypothetical protein MICAG_20010 [Microcystis aeruginosa PCC 9808]